MKACALLAAVYGAADRVLQGVVCVTVACGPTGRRWMLLAQLAAELGMPFMCVQPMASSRARKTEDLTDKADDMEAVLAPC